MLRHARCTDVEVLRQLFQVTYRCRWCHQPTQTPAGHAEILGKTIQDEGLVIDLQHAGGLHPVGQPVIDLIDHQMPIVSTGCRRQTGQLAAVKHGAGRVGRGRHQCANGVLIPIAFDQVSGQLVVDLGAHRYQLRAAFDQTQKVPVARVAGIRQQPVFARIHQQTAGQQQGTGAARRDEDSFGVDAQAIALLVKAGNRLTQRRHTSRRGVAGMPGGQGSLAGLDDRRGGGEIRFADFQVNHITAAGLQLVGAGQQGHDVERFYGAAARTVGLGHQPSLK
ncbi:hypothetical protein D9M71_222240 [compost metagenome]